jgi:D-tyrosyl-tRNA(Tyr) deacylase
VKAVVQRVSRASVRVAGETVGAIEGGIAALIGVAVDDGERDADWLAERIAGLRIFRDDDGRMNRSVGETNGSVLLISQFTLLGDARKGRRPSFVAAAGELQARALFERAGRAIEALGLPVAYGRFGAEMEVELVNAGPVTILLDSKRSF